MAGALLSLLDTTDEDQMEIFISNFITAVKFIEIYDSDEHLRQI